MPAHHVRPECTSAILSLGQQSSVAVSRSPLRRHVAAVVLMIVFSAIGLIDESIGVIVGSADRAFAGLAAVAPSAQLCVPVSAADGAVTAGRGVRLPDAQLRCSPWSAAIKHPVRV